jgi:hypothetical protein
VYTNEKPLFQLNEQLIADLGISVFMGNLMMQVTGRIKQMVQSDIH